MERPIMEFTDIFASPPADPWVWGWEAVAAIGSILAVFAAVMLGARDMVIRWRDSNANAKVAAILILPDLRRYQAGLRRLQAGPAVTEWPWSEDRHLAVARNVGGLQSDNDRVVALGLSLPSNQSLECARIVASVRHALRHATELMVIGETLSDSAIAEKQAAIRTACRSGRSDLVKLLKHCRHVRDVSLRS